jgi:hypothetical protein
MFIKGVYSALTDDYSRRVHISISCSFENARYNLEKEVG